MHCNLMMNYCTYLVTSVQMCHLSLKIAIAGWFIAWQLDFSSSSDGNSSHASVSPEVGQLVLSPIIVKGWQPKHTAWGRQSEHYPTRMLFPAAQWRTQNGWAEPWAGMQILSVVQQSSGLSAHSRDVMGETGGHWLLSSIKLEARPCNHHEFWCM